MSRSMRSSATRPPALMVFSASNPGQDPGQKDGAGAQRVWVDGRSTQGSALLDILTEEIAGANRLKLGEALEKPLALGSLADTWSAY